MTRLFNIFIFFISFTVLSSPLMANAFSLEQAEEKEMSCCTMSHEEHSDNKSEEKKGCCHGSDKKEEKKDCGNNCPMPDCNMTISIVFQLFFEQNKSEEKSTELFTENIQNEFYLSLLNKDLSYSFWHPPKYIS